MPHVDEGTLHALLDGELAPAAVAEVRVHFASCPSCAARLDEARQLLAETERLVNALELPAGSAHPRSAPAVDSGGRQRSPAAGTGAVADVLMPPGPRTPLPPLDPVVLIPENPTIREIRRSRMKVMAWAAGFLVVVGASFLGVSSYQQTPRSSDGRLRISPDEFTTAPPPVQREGATSDSAPTLALSDSASPPSESIAPTAPAKPEGKPATKDAAREQAAPTAPAAAPRLPAAVAAKPPVQQRGAVTTPARNDAVAAAADSNRTPAERESEPDEAVDESAQDGAAATTREEVDRARAAQATYELDRRRTRQRAAEATAELERQRAERQATEERERQLALAAQSEAVTAAPAPPPRPTVDERTGISSRIGLDEAARQLGGPLHAIDGLSRQTVGLVPGNTVEGADPSRPVVRAVYADPSGTLLFLDQQMARPGEGPSTPQTGSGGRQVWVKDGVLLVLHGKGLTADSLRSLSRRVR
jgi:hypothetical protein